jgi:hypothetical protein
MTWQLELGREKYRDFIILEEELNFLDLVFTVTARIPLFWIITAIPRQAGWCSFCQNPNIFYPSLSSGYLKDRLAFAFVRRRR